MDHALLADARVASCVRFLIQRGMTILSRQHIYTASRSRNGIEALAVFGHLWCEQAIIPATPSNVWTVLCHEHLPYACHSSSLHRCC